MLKIAVCDDEKIILDKISRLISLNFSSYNMDVDISSFISAEILMNTEDINDFDVIFLDIELETSNGIDVAKALRGKKYNKLIVFITSYLDYAMDGYKVDAFRFILKTNMEKQLKECVLAIASLFKTKKTEDLDLADFLYVMSDNHRLKIVLANGEEKFKYMTLNDFEEELNSSFFCRVHQSYLVNIRYVELVRRYELTLLGDITIPISKSRYKNASKEIAVGRRLWN